MADDIARAVAVSPDGSKVFVTGESPGADILNQDFTTVAYDAATGTQLWTNRFNGSGNSHDEGYAISVSPDGSAVFATGFSTSLGLNVDYSTVAYDPATGKQLWRSAYSGPDEGSATAVALAVSPGGSKVFVTGYVSGPTGWDYGTVAYEASTGAQLWDETYTSVGTGSDLATAVAVSPGGATVFVTGASAGANGEFDYATVAHDASTGSRRWVRRYNGPGGLNDFPTSIAVAPGGSTVFVTGQSDGLTSGIDIATIAYDAATGGPRWLRRFNGALNSSDFGRSIVVSPGGKKVFVTGLADGNYVTLAYRAGTGSGVWLQYYDGPAQGSDGAYDVAVSPGGSKLYVTGTSNGSNGDSDWATLAYAS